MKKIIQNLRLKLALPVIAGTMVFVPATVFAHQGGDNSGSKQPTSGRSSQHMEAETESNDDPATHEQGDDSVATKNAREKAQELLQTKRQDHKEHTAAQKQKSCEARAANINKRADNYSKHAQKHLDVFNKIFTKVQAFHDDKQLTVADYDTLVATTTAKQAAAHTAVDALKALDVNIDCSQVDPAATVATLKAAIANARIALHEYRKAIKDLVVATKSAAKAQEESSTDAAEDNTSNSTSDTNSEGAGQ